MNPTLLGLFPTFVWGISIPLVRMISMQIGMWETTASVYLLTGLLGFIWLGFHRRFPDHSIMRNPFLYLRGLCFVLNPCLLITASVTVQKDHLPLVILIYYLWPTGIILASMLMAGVKVTRRAAFMLGTLIVVASLWIEIMGGMALSWSLFDNSQDSMAYGMAITAAFAWSFYSALSRRTAAMTGGSDVLPFFQLAIAGIALAFATVTQSSPMENLSAGWASLLLGYAVLQFVALLSWDYAIRHGNVVIISLFADFIPWLLLLTSHFLLGVEIGLRTLFAAVLLVFGGILTRYGTLPKKKPAAALQQFEASIAD